MQKMAEKVNLTIDGVEIEADAGSMIIQAAMDNGLYIPYLCYYPGMKPYGACRMCVVKAESPGPDGSFSIKMFQMVHIKQLLGRRNLIKEHYRKM